MIEYGIFNDEGLLEDGYYVEAEARESLASPVYDGDVHAYVAPICREHHEYRADACPLCEVPDSEEEDADAQRRMWLHEQTLRLEALREEARLL